MAKYENLYAIIYAFNTMTYSTVLDLKNALKQSNASWSVHPRLVDTDPLPKYPLGAVKEELVVASAVPKLDLMKVLSDLPGNPFVYQRRLAQNMLQANKDIAAIVAVHPNLVNEFAGKPLGTNAAEYLKE